MLTSHLQSDAERGSFGPTTIEERQTVRIEADLLIPGRGEPVSNGVAVLEGDTITYAGPGDQAPETPGADTMSSPLDFNPLEDASLWGDPNRITHVWKSGTAVKQPA